MRSLLDEIGVMRMEDVTACWICRKSAWRGMYLTTRDTRHETQNVEARTLLASTHIHAYYLATMNSRSTTPP